MSNTDLRDVTTTTTTIQDFSVDKRVIDESGSNQDETYYENPNWTTNLGYYKQIPELKATIDSLNMWAFGKGWQADPRTSVILRKITGWGEDTFDSIIDNLGRVEDINGDAYAEIIRDEETGILINLKPLNPQRMRTIVNKKGIIKGYDEYDPSTKQVFRRFKPEQIFHTAGGRIANEIHGTSKIEACKWVIDARNEAMADKRRILHRSTIRVIEVDSDNTAAITALKTQWAAAIKNGEVMILPKDNVTFPDVPQLSTAEHSDWIRYLESFYYKSFGVPEVIMGGSAEYTEASSKVGYMTFEVPYQTKQRNMEQDIYNKLGLRITFNRPVSLKEDMQESEAKNTSQVGFQESETTAQIGGVE